MPGSAGVGDDLLGNDLDDIRRACRVTQARGGSPYRRVVGQYFYGLGTEMGHALFDMLSVPLWGRPEDAADQFSAG